MDILDLAKPVLSRWQKLARVVAVLAGLAAILVLWEWASRVAQRPHAIYPVRPFELTLSAIPGQPSPLTEGRVTVDRLSIHYLEGGSGPPVIFCHGLAGNVGHWFRNLGPLTAVAHVYAFDWPGFGLSDRPPEGRMDPAFQVRVLEGFLDAMNLERVTLVGHSLGGHWTSAFALAHPDRVARLVAVDSAAMTLAPPLYRLPLRMLGVRRAFENYARADDPEAAQRALWREALLDREQITPEFLEAVSDYDTMGDPTAVPYTVGAYRGVLRASLRASLHRIRAPTLIVWGAQDRATPVDQGLLLARTLPDARLLLFEDCGHVPFIQEPDRFDRAVAQFLAEPGTPPSR